MANINQNRWDQLIRRVAAIVGPGSKVNNTIGDLFPMIDVENLPGELYLLAGTRLAMGGVVQVGSPGESARVQLFNPDDSGLIVTLTSVQLSVSASQVIRYVINNNAESTNDLGIRVRDTRLGVLTRPTAQVRSASNAAILAGTGEFRILANSPFVFTDPNGIAVLGPGTGITFNTFTAAQTLTANFLWRERVAEASELQF